jgi:glycosyltransferase involved in cell wall biosynthesis
MNDIKKITVITAIRNAEKYIAETVESVLTQSAFLKGILDLEYLVYDANSTDRTVEIIKSYNDPRVKLTIESDNGLYDALAKGFESASGDYICYINAGDYYHKTAFEVVHLQFSKPEIYWISGFCMAYTENSYLVEAELPFIYRSSLIQAGVYGRYLPFIQQESVFWKKELLQLVDLAILRKFKLAGDYYLWHCFSKQYELRIVQAYLGGFKRHSGQVSEDKTNYFKEVSQIIDKKKISIFQCAVVIFDKIIWQFSSKYRRLLNSKLILIKD